MYLYTGTIRVGGNGAAAATSATIAASPEPLHTLPCPVLGHPTTPQQQQQRIRTINKPGVRVQYCTTPVPDVLIQALSNAALVLILLRSSSEGFA